MQRLGPTLNAMPAGPALSGAVAWTTGTDVSYVDSAGKLVQVDVERVRAGQPAEPVPVDGLQPGDRPVLVTSS